MNSMKSIYNPQTNERERGSFDDQRMSHAQYLYELNLRSEAKAMNKTRAVSGKQI